MVNTDRAKRHRANLQLQIKAPKQEQITTARKRLHETIDYNFVSGAVSHRGNSDTDKTIKESEFNKLNDL